MEMKEHIERFACVCLCVGSHFFLVVVLCVTDIQPVRLVTVGRLSRAMYLGFYKFD